MRVLRSLSVLGLLVPGLLAAPALTTAASAEPTPVAPVVQELGVTGVDEQAAQSSSPSGVAGALATGSGRRTVLLTDLLDTRPFDLAGVTWDASPDVETVQAWIRTRSGGVWSDWQDLGGTADDQPDTGTPDTTAARRGGTSPLWVGLADGIQARVDVLSGADPTGIRLSLIDPGESAADAVPAQSASLSTSGGWQGPVVRSRADWGADESIRRGSPSYASGTRGVAIHHTASANDYSAADVPRLLRGFYAYHVKSQGWSDIGYNFLVDRFGTVWEGRAGGISRSVIGAHSGGFNTGTVGVSMIGTYESVTPSAAMLEAVSQVTAWRLALAGVDPRGTVSLASGGSTRYRAGTVVSLPRVFAHRDVSTTSCPGDEGVAALPTIRSRAAALAAGAAPALIDPGPVSLELATPTSVSVGATVPVKVTGTPGAAVQVWFAKRGDLGFTQRRDGVLSSAGIYSTSYLADDDYTLFAISGSSATARRTTRISPTPTGAPVTGTPLRVQGPVTTPAGLPVLVTATGPAGAAVSVWFRRQGDAAFVQRRAGVLGADGTYTTSYTADVPHEYFVMGATVTSNDATTLVGPVPNGLDVTAPAGVDPGVRVEVVVQGKPGQQAEVWFQRRGETAWTRRREAVLGPDGTFRTSYIANDEYRYFAVSGTRTSKRVRTQLSTLPPLATLPAPRVQLEAPTQVEAGSPVSVQVKGAAGAPVQVWFRRRGAEVWSRLRDGQFDASGRWSTSYAGVDDHEYWAASGGFSSPDAATLTMPTVAGPLKAALGSKVLLAGRARPGDTVVVESRRRDATAWVRTTLTADSAGLFRTSYAADDEYEYRPVADKRVGELRRTTVAPTVAGAGAVRRGSTVTLTGTARPGAEVEVLFRRDGAPSLMVGGRRNRDLPTFRVGRVLTAGVDGRWTTTFAPTVEHSWYARSDGNATPVRTTVVR